MADSEKTKNTLPSDTEESVDDILASILNKDGSFNSEFSNLFSRYIGGENDSRSSDSIGSIDLSDRSGEALTRHHVQFEAEPAPAVNENIDRRIEEKIPEAVREIYSEAASDAQRPEFTSTGNVKYPTMGVGDSEERVVFDADWEEKAKKEAARLERVRQDRMLRGDSTYVRSFVTRGTVPYRSPYIDALSDVNQAYINPLSDDDDFRNANMNSDYYNSDKKSFFQEGFSVAQKNNAAADGKTRKNSKKASGENSRKAAAKKKPSDDWMQVETPQEKKKRMRGSWKEDYMHPDFEIKTENKSRKKSQPKKEKSEKKRKLILADSKEMATVEEETNDLRSTVADIVEKYNRRTQEEERKKAEEEAKIEALKKEQERLEKKKRAEIAKLRKNMSQELIDVLSTEENASDDYEDFTQDDLIEAEEEAMEEEQAAREEEKFIEHEDEIKEEVYVPGQDYTEKLKRKKKKNKTASAPAAGNSENKKSDVNEPLISEQDKENMKHDGRLTSEKDIKKHKSKNKQPGNKNRRRKSK